VEGGVGGEGEKKAVKFPAIVLGVGLLVTARLLLWLDEPPSGFCRHSSKESAECEAKLKHECCMVPEVAQGTAPAKQTVACPCSVPASAPECRHRQHQLGYINE